MGTVSMVLGFYAVSMLPLADATALGFSQPLFSVLRRRRDRRREGPLAALERNHRGLHRACW